MRGTKEKEKERKTMAVKRLDELDDNPVTFKARPRDRLHIDAVARKLDMSRSETVRRAIRLGLAQLEQMSFPGGGAVLDKDLNI
jgi:hypothetical protein